MPPKITPTPYRIGWPGHLVAGCRQAQEAAPCVFDHHTIWNATRKTHFLLVSFLLLTLTTGCQNQSAPPTPPPPPSTTAATTTGPAPTPPPDKLETPDAPPPPSKPAAPWESPNEQTLAQAGLRIFTGRHLRLCTDLPEEVAQSLLAPADQFWEFLEQTLGTETRRGIPWSKGPVLLYLMGRQQTFADAGLIPPTIPQHRAGWHLDQVTWVVNPTTNYFRRHIIFHELFHAFWNRRRLPIPPPWLDEGLAEYFATHRLEKDSLTFAVIPHNREELDDWGRIHLIQQQVKQGQLPTTSHIRRWVSKDYQELPTYAWSWGLLCFLDHHPRYHPILRGWIKNWATSPPTEADFDKLFSAEFEAEWQLFAEELDYGWDGTRAAIEFPPTPPFPPLTASQEFRILSDRGWQLAPFSLKGGQICRLTAQGRVILGNTPRTWISEPAGVSARYYRGQPLGKLIGRFLVRTPAGNWKFTPPFSVGPSFTLTPHPHIDTFLYLRVNDAWGELQDNKGAFSVTCAPQASAK